METLGVEIGMIGAGMVAFAAGGSAAAGLVSTGVILATDGGGLIDLVTSNIACRATDCIESCSLRETSNDGVGASTAGFGGATSTDFGGATSTDFGGATSTGFGEATSNGFGEATSNGFGEATSNGLGGATSTGLSTFILGSTAGDLAVGDSMSGFGIIAGVSVDGPGLVLEVTGSDVGGFPSMPKTFGGGDSLRS